MTINKHKTFIFPENKTLAKINKLHEHLGFDKLQALQSKLVNPGLQELLAKQKAIQPKTISILRNTIPLSAVFAQHDALDCLRQITIPDHIRMFSDAGNLYAALKEEDHLTASDIMTAYEPVFPLLRLVIALAEMPNEERLEVLKETNDQLEKEIVAYKERNKSRTEKATASRKINAKSHEINSYFLRLENAGRNLYESQITTKIAAEFGVSQQHVRNLRKIYLHSKDIKKRN